MIVVSVRLGFKLWLGVWLGNAQGKHYANPYPTEIDRSHVAMVIVKVNDTQNKIR